ncbi:hypothetical protein EWM64_g2314 [Hericium alpestre]|uniref:Uncharacterized protein n=1 Tax=Hericium alpestre TaxID=135208 RepID=A0A4Z0A4R2_9AGAM|nr:hypothetical protein EWM64_g2314 [Hericium alpestre]
MARPSLVSFAHTLASVTSVGATAYLPPELSAPYSSGGFSNIFARPTYQDAAVSSFLDQLGDT